MCCHFICCVKQRHRNSFIGRGRSAVEKLQQLNGLHRDCHADPNFANCKLLKPFKANFFLCQFAPNLASTKFRSIRILRFMEKSSQLLCIFIAHTLPRSDDKTHFIAAQIFCNEDIIGEIPGMCSVDVFSIILEIQ